VTTAYVDASALAKLALREPESVAMTRWYVEADRVLASRIAVVETRRAVARRALGTDAPSSIDRALRSVEIIEFDEAIAERAAALGSPALRTLDAIHVATALEIGPIDAFVTYDDRLADAARLVGLPVVRPA
jgi:hypothetical protein